MQVKRKKIYDCVWLLYKMKLIILFQWTILQLQVKTRLESTLYWYTLAAYYVGFLQTSIFKHNFHKKRKQVCIKTRSNSP